MLAGRLGNEKGSRTLDVNSTFEAVGKYAKGEMSEDELTELEEAACPGCGSCAGMFTANTMKLPDRSDWLGLARNGTIRPSM